MTGPFEFERVLWARTAREVVYYSPLDGEQSADCAIVGAGYTGLSAALHLAEAGRTVAVLEAAQPGHGASGRNAGGFAPLYLDHGPDSVVRLLGQERGRRLNALVADGPRLVRALIARHDIDADLDGRGLFIAAHDRAAEERLRSLGSAWRAAGAGVEILSRDEAQARAGSEKVGGGLYFTEGGTLNPLSYARGLARAATQAGAGIYGHSAVTGIIPAGTGWRVQTASGAVTARSVLIATDAYAAHGSLWPGLERMSYRIPVAMLASRPLDADRAAAFRAILPLADSSKSNPFWLMIDGAGRLVASLLPPRRDGVTAEAVARPLMDKMRRLYGSLPEVSWSDFWIGMVGVGRERCPRALGLAPGDMGGDMGGVVAVGGYCGQGIATATAAGRDYAEFVIGGARAGSMALPFLPPRTLPLTGMLPGLVRAVAAPLGRLGDRSYATTFR